MNLRAVDLNLLPILEALLTHRSTTVAAQKLGLSQSAVSAALGRLRLALEDPLFVRHGQGIVPTEAARDLELPLKQILTDIQNLMKHRDEFDPSSAQNSFKLSGSDFYSELLMPRLGQRFAIEAPNMRLQMVDLVPDNYVRTLEQAAIDLAILPRAVFPEWIDAEVVHRSSFALIAAQNHPAFRAAGLRPLEVAPLDLVCGLDYALFSPEGKSHGMGDQALARIGRSRRVVITLPVFSAILNVVAQSDLAAFVPEQIALEMGARAGVSVYRLPFAMPEVQLTMVWHRRHSAAQAHKWLRQTIAAELARLNHVRLHLLRTPTGESRAPMAG